MSLELNEELAKALRQFAAGQSKAKTEEKSTGVHGFAIVDVLPDSFDEAPVRFDLNLGDGLLLYYDRPPERVSEKDVDILNITGDTDPGLVAKIYVDSKSGSLHAGIGEAIKTINMETREEWRVIQGDLGKSKYQIVFGEDVKAVQKVRMPLITAMVEKKMESF